jgi:tryptophan-rich sensory protein
MKLNHFFIPYIAVMAFLFGNILVSGGIDWYQTLVLPPWHPSVELIAIIWAIIYFAGAWSLLITWNKTEHDPEFRWVMGGYLFCLLLNLVWSTIFFQFHMIEAAVWCASILGICVLLLAILLVMRAPKAALLLIPYVVWVFVAAYLLHMVAMLNA